MRTEDVAPLAARIHSAIADQAPYCCGFACAPDDGTDIDTLYRVADQALYASKRSIADPSPSRRPRTQRAGRRLLNA
jgi:GGDEF domain-containing protein